jgi:uncharacterized protein (TIGR02421 family)
LVAAEPRRQSGRLLEFHGVTDAKTYLRRICDEIVALQKPLRILKAINWDPKVHERFFANKARLLPKIEYPPLGYDASAIARQFAALQRRIRGKSTLEALLREKCDEFALIARMLEARGSAAFYQHSVELYGNPRDRYAAHPGVDNLKVARLWAARPTARGEKPTLESARVVEIVKGIVEPHLGRAVRVRESTRLTANAAAGGTRVAVKKGARFTARQARALAHHEGLWHVLTSLNGFAQPVLTVLGVGLPRFTESQEGGGIVSEFLTGNITDDRYIELGERTLAVDMAARGADYLEVFDYLCERFEPPKAALMAERVFRGGLLTGAAPFTKDAAYQRGYCRIYNFLRVALAKPDPAIVLAFLAGKMRVDDAPLVKELIDDGICVGPTYLPEWFLDQDSLYAHVTHSLTVNRFSVPRGRRHYEQQVAAAEAWDLEGIGEAEPLGAHAAQVPKVHLHEEDVAPNPSPRPPPLRGAQERG